MSSKRDTPTLFPVAGRRSRRPAARAVVPDAAGRVVSVLPAEAAVERTFDYLVPPELDGVRVGSVVRADFGGRRIGGWVVADRVEPPDGLALRPLTRLTGWGPPVEIVELSAWGAWRWAGRRSRLLASASPGGAVTGLPAPDRRRPAAPARRGELATLVEAACAAAVGILRLPPDTDTTTAVAMVAQRGPTLVVVPSIQRAAVLAERLRRAGAGVAELPHQWAQARAGAGVVVGARAAAWGPCPGLAAVVVVDAHDEALVQQQAPQWWATEVVAERARRAGVPCVWISPCPTLDLLAAGTLVTPDVQTERSGWAVLEVVDRRRDDPRLGLYSERLVHELRSAERAVCVLNRTGRARLLACGTCGELTRCERCGAAVAQLSGAAAPHPLICARCGTVRPPVCAACDSTRLRHLRVGVSRAREELEALTGRPVAEVTATTGQLADVPLVVGTEAVLRRVGASDVVAFLEFDQELVAPRFRAAEEALTLLARAARIVGGRRRGGRVLVQTRSPDHAALRAAVRADPDILSRAEADVRATLGLPPFRALATLRGPGAAELAAALAGVVPARGPALGGLPFEGGSGGASVGRGWVPSEPGRAAGMHGAAPDLDGGGPGAVPTGVEVLGPADDRWVVRAGTIGIICDALAGAPRPAARVHVEVDPLRI
jgi:primosomal protein N' (replication factor Y)